MSPRDSKRLIFLVDGLTKEQKQEYYRVCGVAASRLSTQGCAPLNTKQCELICERLRSDQRVNMDDIKALGPPKITPRPREEPPAPTPDLFDSSGPGSSSSSGPTPT